MGEQNENLGSREILSFYPEDDRHLENVGFKIYTLYGRSIGDFVSKGLKLEGIAEPQLLKLTSIKSQVAIDPKNIFIPNSGNKTKEQQAKLASSYASDLISRIKAQFAVDFGSVADWTELSYEHYRTTGQWLFDRKRLNGAYFTLTTTEDEISGKFGRAYYFGCPWFEGDIRITRNLEDKTKAESLRVATLIKPIGFGRLNPQNN